MKSVYAAVTAAALAALIGPGFAQSAPAGSTAGAQASPPADAEAAEQGKESDPAKSSDAAKKAVPKRSEAVRAESQRIARNAPKRDWPEIPSTPARDNTVMFEIFAKKASDVPIIASVDQQNKLELLDITGEGVSDTLQFPTPGLGGSKSASAAEGAAPEAGAQEGASSASDEGKAQAGPETAPTLDSLADEGASPQP